MRIRAFAFATPCVVLGVVQACGGSVATDGTRATGGSSGVGYGGTPMGGYGGTPMGGYGGTQIGGYGGACSNCTSWKLAEVIPMAACCAYGTECGAEVNDTNSFLFAIAPGCYALAQPGVPDSNCPSIAFTDPLDNHPSQHAGCCRSGTGMCGVNVDFTAYGGPYLGCVAGGTLPQPCGSNADCETCVAQNCASEVDSCSANVECVQIVECASSCADPSCEASCVAKNPGGEQDFYALKACAQAHCAAECF